MRFTWDSWQLLFAEETQPVTGVIPALGGDAAAVTRRYTVSRLPEKELCLRAADDAETWWSYISLYTPEEAPYIEALREEVLRLGVMESGYWHQNSDEGVPVAEDGTVVCGGMRAWGSLLAAVWNSALACGELRYSYVDFAFGARRKDE